MDKTVKKQIIALRAGGNSYTVIAEKLALSVNTVKSFCRRKGLGSVSSSAMCKQCGRAIIQKKAKKPRQFCSDVCRFAWWKAHPDAVRHRTVYSYTCAGCGKAFEVYRKRVRKYCSRVCYIKDRYGEGGDGNG